MAKTDQMIKRQDYLKKYIAGEVTRKEAAFALGISPRQFARVINRFKEQGVDGLKHRNIGHRVLNRTPDEVTAKVIELVRDKYQGEHLLAAHRKIREVDAVQISYSTLRRICLDAGLIQANSNASRVVDSANDYESDMMEDSLVTQSSA